MDTQQNKQLNQDPGLLVKPLIALEPSPFDVEDQPPPPQAPAPIANAPPLANQKSFPSAFELPPLPSSSMIHSPPKQSSGDNLEFSNGISVPLPSGADDGVYNTITSQNVRKSWVRRVQARTDEVRKLFSLGPSEQLMDDYMCALKKRVLLQGRMYIFEHHLCFYSSLFGHQKLKVIPLEKVLDVRKKKNVGFPNSLEVTWACPPTGDAKKEFFTSFVSREDAYRLILGLWAQHSEMGRAKLAETERSSDEEGMNHGGTASSVLQYKNPVKRLIKSVGTGKSVALPGTSAGAAGDTDHSGQDDLMSPTAESVSNVNWNDPLRVVIPEESFLSDPDLDHPRSSIDPDGRDQSTPRAGAYSGDVAEFEEGQTGEGGSLDREFEGAQQEAPAPSNQMQRVMQCELPCTPRAFWTNFLSGTSDFFFKFHEKQGHYNIRLDPWQRHFKVGNVRDLRFVSLFKGWRMGQQQALCHQTQRYSVYQGDTLVFETSQVMSEIPYSDHFKVETRWNVSPAGQSACHLEVYINVPFNKQTMWRKFIEKSVTDNLMEALDTFKLLASQELESTTIVTSEASLSHSTYQPISPVSVTAPNMPNEDLLPESNEEWEALLAKVDPKWRGGLRSLRKMHLAGSLTPVRSMHRRRGSKCNIMESLNLNSGVLNLASVTEEPEQVVVPELTTSEHNTRGKYQQNKGRKVSDFWNRNGMKLLLCLFLVIVMSLQLVIVVLQLRQPQGSAAASLLRGQPADGSAVTQELASLLKQLKALQDDGQKW